MSPNPPPATGRTPAYRRLVLPDGSVAEVARQGEWALVRMPSGTEGRIRTAELEAFLARGGRRAPTRADVVREFQRGFRRTMWHLVGLAVLILAIIIGLLILRLAYGD